jgi:DNA ligase-1
MQLSDLVTVSATVASTSGRLEKIGALASLLARLEPDEIDIAIGFLSGEPRQGRLGIGPAAIVEARSVAAAADARLSLRDVDASFAALKTIGGAGSTRERAARLRELLASATVPEQDFLARLLFGELRQGALEGVLVEAVARAANVPAASVRRAVMMAGDLAAVARAVLVEGEAALASFAVQLLRPVQPMLADAADDVEAALAALGGEAALELKIDGARIQVHKAGDEVRVFSRQLREVTPAVPEVVEVVSALPARDLVLDGEVIAMRADGTPEPFQVTMRRFGRRLDVDRLRTELPLTPYFFDLVYLDGQPLLDEPQQRRFSTLAQLAGPSLLVPHVQGPTVAQAEAFYDEATRRGHEGVMAKSPSAPYAAGRRGSAWLKVKASHTLDLVVLAVEWGSGRRKGWLSNLHLGARDTERGGFVMLGKTFKGLTDEMLRWQTEQFLARELAREDYIVHVRPELVAEIAFSDVQVSPRYPGRLALRLARVKRYRPDKTAAQADTFATVQAIFRKATGQEPPPR